MGTQRVHMKGFLPCGFVASSCWYKNFLVCTGCSSWPRDKIFFPSPYTISVYLSPSPSRLYWQSCSIVLVMFWRKTHDLDIPKVTRGGEFWFRSLSPSCVQKSLTQSCLKLTISGYPYDLLESRPQSFLTAFRSLLHSANYSVEWSGQVWQPSADSNGCLVHFFLNLKSTKQPLVSRGILTHDQESSNLKKWAPNCHYHLQRAVTPDWMGSTLWEHITVFFLQGQRNLRI